MKRLFVFFLLISQVGFSQSERSGLFRNGDRVCFVGNSITHGGEFHTNIFLYYATRFPKEKVSFFNCGISGDVAGGIISRMDSDILIHQPTVSVLMIGMNDVNRNLYSKTNEGNLEADQKKAEALNIYKKNTTKIAEIFTQYGCKQMIQLPSIYDQTAKIPAENFYGVNDALGKCAEHLNNMAPAFNATVIDYFSLMKSINEMGQKTDSTFTIVGKDRVHPQSAGNMVMAYQFLKTTGAPKYVSKMVFNAGSKKPLENVNCGVKIKFSKKNKLRFECIENALPFPVKKEAKQALSMVDFTEDLNQEVLQVRDLEPGNYALLIDQIYTGSFSSVELQQGINLSGDTLTPQYRQSLSVMEMCNEYRAVSGLLRNIAYIEYKHLGDFDGDRRNLNDVNTFLKEKITKTTNVWIQSNLEQYQVNKPKQNFYKMRLEEIRNEIYTANIPVTHLFELIKK